MTAATETPKSPAETRALECASKYLTKAGAKPDIADYADCMGLAEATKLELVSWPPTIAVWRDRWGDDAVAILLQLLGMSLSISLLSLGAPFWYATLSNLIKLRSTMSQKEEAARVERQTMQAG